MNFDGILKKRWGARHGAGKVLAGASRILTFGRVTEQREGASWWDDDNAGATPVTSGNFTFRPVFPKMSKGTLAAGRIQFERVAEH